MGTMWTMFAGLLLLLPAFALGQTTALPMRIQWEMVGPMGPEGGPRPPFTVAMAQSYTYRLYRLNDPASGAPLTGVTCTTTADPFTKTCSVSPVPMGYDAVGQSVDMTAVISGIETPHSNTAVVPPPLQPPGPPSNLRFIASLLLQPARVLGSRLF